MAATRGGGSPARRLPAPPGPHIAAGRGAFPQIPDRTPRAGYPKGAAPCPTRTPPRLRASTRTRSRRPTPTRSSPRPTKPARAGMVRSGDPATGPEGCPHETNRPRHLTASQQPATRAVAGCFVCLERTAVGTRVDFYVGRGVTAEWLGSYPFDGYPYGVFERNEVLPGDEQGWRDWVTRFLAHNVDRATLPDQGWPWPWDDSGTTDYAYAFDLDDGRVYGSNFGHAWFEVDTADEQFGQPEDETPKAAVFPNMAHRRAVAYGPRSGLIVLGGPSVQEGQ